MDNDWYYFARFVNSISFDRTTIDWLNSAGVQGRVIQSMYETEVALSLQTQSKEMETQNGTSSK